MPVKLEKEKGGKIRVSTPGGVKSKGTTMAKAKRQRNLINAVEHSDWRPTGEPARESLKKRVTRPV
jgi:hypothetical protein